MRAYQIKDIYKQAQDDQEPMLSAYNATWWAQYVSNYSQFDRLFKKKYSSWFPMGQEKEDTLSDIADDFRADVYAFLMANDKRYAELWRMNTIPDNDAYSLTNNVDYTETLQRTENKHGQNVKGSETITDNGSNAYGSQDVSVDKDYTEGARTDTHEHKESSYNESTYSPVSFDEDVKGRAVNEEDGKTTYGSHTDTISNTRIEGQRTDTSSENAGASQTMRKVGNMGVQTVDDMLAKHQGVWLNFDFYGIVFSEIARDLLRGVDDVCCPWI